MHQYASDYARLGFLKRAAGPVAGQLKGVDVRLREGLQEKAQGSCHTHNHEDPQEEAEVMPEAELERKKKT